MSEVDAHFHIWNLEKFDYPWPNEDVKAIFKTIDSPEFLEAIATCSDVRRAVFIQCLNDNVAEARWVLEKNCEKISGVVAGVNLTDVKKLREQLEELIQFPKFVGVRHILDMEETDWITSDIVIQGLKIISEYNLTFDFLSRPHHLKHVSTVAKQLPDLRIVIDHIAKPHLSQSTTPTEEWKQDMKAAAALPNVYCKISGLVTEVDPVNNSTRWDMSTFREHVHFVLDVFGADRCMVGSDWPVLRLTGACYKSVNELHKSLIGHLSQDEQARVLRGTAEQFYQLKAVC